ncbi:MAG TPA: hypothetical protein VNQ77_16980 [Frankiaceae bacterium]|nr:hypothetical protein [Frankiaceae bacterium]
MSDYEELRAEIAALRAQVSALAGRNGVAAPAEDEDEAVSRRGLLGKLAGAAVAGAGLSMLGAAPAEATAGYMRFGETNDAGADQTTLKSSNTGTTLDVWQQGTGICLGADITHTTSTNPVFWARHNGYGNVIDAAVLNSSSQAACISGWSSIGTGVVGTGYNGVRGESTNGIGVHATDAAGGRGLSAYSNTGDAITGYSNGGYGAWLTGAKAPLKLEPHGSDGPPLGGSHARGEVMVDVNGTVWVCLTGGSPGTWVRPGFNPLVKRLVSSGTTTGSYAAAQKKDVTATGVPAGVTAVALNITATSTGSGSVTVYPYGAARPGVAHLAVNPQYRWTGFAIVQLGAGNKFSVYNSSGTTKMSIDLAGFFA